MVDLKSNDKKSRGAARLKFILSWLRMRKVVLWFDDISLLQRLSKTFLSGQIVSRAPLKTLLWLLTCSFFQLLPFRNTHLAQLNSVFSALYLKKTTALSFQTELLEMPSS
jgi:hypothetical protein